MMLVIAGMQDVSMFFWLVGPDFKIEKYRPDIGPSLTAAFNGEKLTAISLKNVRSPRDPLCTGNESAQVRHDVDLRARQTLEHHALKVESEMHNSGNQYLNTLERRAQAFT